VLGPALAAGVPGAAGTRPALRRAEADYRAHVASARPDLATRFGFGGTDARLEPVTEATLTRDAEWLDAFEARVSAIDRGALRPAEAAALDSLRARVAREREPYARGAWRREPALYLALGPSAVLDVAGATRGSPCGRGRNAVGRLRALPEVLRAARVNLGAATGSAGDEAAAPWHAAMDSLRALPVRLAGCREPMREADLVEADSLALAACERFVRFLREEWTVPGGATEGNH
jgi:hypothetical protein